MNITVIGAGNGGQAIAGYCASEGYSVCLYNRSFSKIKNISDGKPIKLVGKIEKEATIPFVTDNIREAVEFADLIMIVTTATAHYSIAKDILPYLHSGQTIVLNPGRTLGLLEFNAILNERPELNINIAEAQTLVFACRLKSEGLVNIIGVKDKVLIAGRNRTETQIVVNRINRIFSCFVGAKNFIQTSLENIGAIFHPSIVLFNAASIERNDKFYFYRDMTDEIANFIEKLDKERLAIGQAYGVQLMSVFEWLTYAYPQTFGNTLKERMKNNPAYNEIMGPGTIFTRQLTEDIPTGLIPMSELAKIAKIQTPLMNAIITLSSSLLSIDFSQSARTLEKLKLNNLTPKEIFRSLDNVIAK